MRAIPFSPSGYCELGSDSQSLGHEPSSENCIHNRALRFTPTTSYLTDALSLSAPGLIQGSHLMHGKLSHGSLTYSLISHNHFSLLHRYFFHSTLFHTDHLSCSWPSPQLHISYIISYCSLQEPVLHSL